METLIHADIFFFVTTIVVIIFAILGIIFMIYLIRILDDIHRSTSLLEDKIQGASDDIAEIRKKVRESIIFNLLFMKKGKKSAQVLNKKMGKKKTSNLGRNLGIGMGIAALSAGAYLFFGPDAKKNQKKLKSLSMKVKSEIFEKMENAKEVTAPVFANIVDEVSNKYGKLKNVDSKELEAEIKKIKSQWKGMVKHAQTTAPKAKKPAKKKARA